MHYQTPPGGTSAFLMLSTDYNVLSSRLIALNNFIQCSHCQVVQLFRITSFLLKAFITRTTKHSLLVRCVFRQICASNFSKSSVHNPIKIVSELSISEIESITFSGVWKMLGLLLVLPDTNATLERSFSAKKWKKTYVCTTRAYDRKVQKVHRSRTR